MGSTDRVSAWRWVCLGRALLLTALIAAGCARPLNEPLAGGGNQTRAALVAVEDADGVFFGVALSGGGSRSAVFSAECLARLERMGLRERIDVVAASSGGALAGAWYCTTPDAGDIAARHRLRQDMTTELTLRALMPWNWVAAAVSEYDRTWLLSDVFQRRLLSAEGRALTFADLRADRPRLLISATEMNEARRFVFCNENFNELASDLGRYPLADAAAASSAVPGALSPLALRDHTCGGRYLHLGDSGISDNLGIQSLIEAYDRTEASASAAGRAAVYRRGVVLVIIDAAIVPRPFDQTRRGMGLIQSIAAGINAGGTALLGRGNQASLRDAVVGLCADDTPANEVRRMIDALERQGWCRFRGRGGAPVLIVQIALRLLDADADGRALLRELSREPTSFSVSPAYARKLEAAAERLLEDMSGAGLGAFVEVGPTPPLDGTTAPAAR